MGMIILKLGPKCFSGIYWNLILYKVKLGCQGKRSSEQSDNVWNLIRLQNDSIDG
jgi:hypothetical protein